ncbi:hypothetical protein FKW77_005518 [Venturia effusa]|uniref:Uncharacterized protein n=1 Tax=Venturia effusa TaxID=50376 RepID=A0A517L5D2_9PEZI|nr:hypothetical protein FKW77_005518 [Venturia effusa]
MAEEEQVDSTILPGGDFTRSNRWPNVAVGIFGVAQDALLLRSQVMAEDQVRESHNNKIRYEALLDESKGLRNEVRDLVDEVSELRASQGNILKLLGAIAEKQAVNTEELDLEDLTRRTQGRKRRSSSPRIRLSSSLTSSKTSPMAPRTPLGALTEEGIVDNSEKTPSPSPSGKDKKAAYERLAA